jgi:hypothetical protein
VYTEILQVPEKNIRNPNRKNKKAEENFINRNCMIILLSGCYYDDQMENNEMGWGLEHDVKIEYL